MFRCAEAYKNIKRDIRAGTTRGKSPVVLKRLRQKVKQLSQKCNGNLAQSLELFLDLTFNERAIDEIVKAAQKLVDDSNTSPFARIDCLLLIARLTVSSIPHEQNFYLRNKALQIAQAENLIVLEVIIQINWLDSLIRFSYYEKAFEKVEQIEKLLQTIPTKVKKEVEIYEVTNRYLTHKAKLAFRKARNSNFNEITNLINEANSFYSTAISRDSGNDHFRSNEQVEWAEELLMLQSDTGIPTSRDAERILLEASHSLDAHSCKGICNAYFHQIQALLFDLRGDECLNQHPELAAKYWQDAISSCKKSAHLYNELNHPNREEPLSMSVEIEKKIELINRPRKIFLSHSSKDKEFVREFKDTLKLLRFEPWLDEDAMTAGVKLERGLYNGLEDSCAAIFFVTPSFEDTNFLATEIDYAIAQKRKKGKYFSIITLVFKNEIDDIKVPDLLQPYVWKTPANQIEALREIIKALPLTISYPEWGD